MGRSTKKGPWVEERLMGRISAMNEAGKKQMVKTWSRTSTVFPEMVGHTIAVHDGKNTSRSSSPSRWSGTSSASSPRPAPSAPTPAPAGVTSDGRREKRHQSQSGAQIKQQKTAEKKQRKKRLRKKPRAKRAKRRQPKKPQRKKRLPKKPMAKKSRPRKLSRKHPPRRRSSAPAPATCGSRLARHA